MTKYALLDNTIPYSPHLGYIFGVCGALLLQQIHYWCSVNKGKQKNYYEGHYWCYNSHKQWAQQFWDFSERTVRRKIDELVTEKVVVLGTFNKLSYDKTSWYRINYERLNEILLAKPHPANLAAWKGQFGHMDTANLAAPIPENSAETFPEITLASQKPPISPTEEDDSEMIQKNPKGMVKGKAPITSADVQKQLGTHKPTQVQNSAKGLYHVWANTVPKHVKGVKFVAPFNGKQLGQMTKMVKMWGDQAPQVLEFVLSHWIKFGKYVTVQAGVSMVPEAPSTDYLTKHMALALNFYLTQQPKVSAINCTEPKQSPGQDPGKKGKITIKKLSQAQSLGGVTSVDKAEPPKKAPQPVTVVEEDDEDDRPITLKELLELKPIV